MSICQLSPSSPSPSHHPSLTTNLHTLLSPPHFPLLSSPLISVAKLFGKNRSIGNDTTPSHHPLTTLSPTTPFPSHPLFSFSVAKLFGKNRSIGNDTTPFIAFTYFVYHMVVVGVHTVEILFVK